MVSGDWVIIAPRRSKRPEDFLKNVSKRQKSPVALCPFENPEKSGHQKAVLVYPDLKNHRRDVGVNWELQIIPNKYPALSDKKRKVIFSKHGAYNVVSGVGHHEILITRDHNKNFDGLSPIKSFHVFRAFRERYLELSKDKNIAYVSIFQNWGPRAGATVYHPHYQIIAMPVVSPHVLRSFLGSESYFKKHGYCVHCAIIKQEKKDKKRIIFENSGAIAFSPFASPNPYEVAVFPKKHLPFFEDTPDSELESVSSALREALRLIKKNLKDSDYNFFIHTTPVKGKEKYKHYHWHIEILPKFSTSGGFEFGTGAMINIVNPDEAARILRK